MTIFPKLLQVCYPLCTNSLQRKHLERFPLVTGTFDSVSFSSSGMKQCQCLDSHPAPPPPPKFRQVEIGALSTVLHLYKIVFTMNWPLQFFQTCKKKSDKNLHLQFESGQKYPTCIPYEVIKLIFYRRQTRKDFIYSIQNLLLSIKVLSIIPVSRS